MLPANRALVAKFKGLPNGFIATHQGKHPLKKHDSSLVLHLRFMKIIELVSLYALQPSVVGKHKLLIDKEMMAIQRLGICRAPMLMGCFKAHLTSSAQFHISI